MQVYTHTLFTCEWYLDGFCVYHFLGLVRMGFDEEMEWEGMSLGVVSFQISRAALTRI